MGSTSSKTLIDHPLDLPNSKFPILSLPNELLIKVIEKMNLEDRKTIRSIDYRLVGLEKHAGYRCFSKIEFNAHINKNINTFTNNGHFNTIDVNVTGKGLESLFNHASTDHLLVGGNGMDGEVAKKMNVTFKTLHFRKITFSSYNVHSENLLSELLNGDRDVNDVNIEWNNDFSIDNIAIFFRTVDKYEISTNWMNPNSLISDHAFLNLVRNSNRTLLNGLTNISASALVEAFEMVVNSSKGKIVECLCHKIEMEHFIRLLNVWRLSEERTMVGDWTYATRTCKISGVSLQFKHCFTNVEAVRMVN